MSKVKSLFRAQRLVFVLLIAALSAAWAEQGAKYLIIAADNYVNIVKPLADWRTKKGLLAKVVPLSQVGSTPAAIQTYIRNAWSTWPVPPEYVLLAGSPDLIPSYNNANDCYYGNMTGNYLMEISVGRLFATTARECSTMVNKVLAYEKPAWTGDTLWYIKGSVCVGEDGSSDDSIYWRNSRLAMGYWIGRGYVQVDSFSSNRGNNSADVNAAASDGRNFIAYRGEGVSYWWGYPSITPGTWTNGVKLPIVVGATCQTLTLSPGESMYADQFVRAGSPLALGGALVYFGTTGVITGGAFYRGAVHEGLFNALFGEKESRLGPATIRARYHVDSLYHVQARYEEWNLLGDPALYVWTAEPMHATVIYDSVIPMAPQDLAVQVLGNGANAQGATVCVMMDSTVYVTGLTNSLGQATVAINPVHVGTMSVTVTGAGLLPFESTARTVIASEPYMVVDSTAIDDYVGNHDGGANPGEAMHVGIGLRNLGGVTANGVSAVLHISQAGVSVSDSTSSYGTIVPNSAVMGDPFDIALDTGFADGQLVSGTLHAADDSAHSWDCAVTLVVRAGRLQFSAVTLLDSAPGGNNNGRLGRGESGLIELALHNAGGAGVGAVHALVTCADTVVVLTDSQSWYGNVAAGQTVSGNRDRLAVAAGLGLPRALPVTFHAHVWADGGTYRYSDTFSFQIPGEQGTSVEPTGPDAYGYWCYDNTDTASGRAPTYDWVELSSGLGTEIAAVSDSDAVTRTLTMPFTFKMYNQTNTVMSVCSNGFLALGTTTYKRGTNAPIPDTAGPPLLIAPFWDDLNPDEGSNGYGTAYQYSDTANHRWIVEYKDFAHYNQQSIRETFEAIFYDPAYYPTPTGDGEIVFQYNRVSLNSSMTLGIKDNTETRGIQYVYNNTYAPTAAYVQVGRAVKFTTNPPRSMTQPWLVIDGFVVSDSLYGNGNGVGEPGELLTVSVTVRNGGFGQADNVVGTLRALDGEGSVVDSSAMLGNIAAGGQASNAGQPFTYRVATTTADSVADVAVALTGDGYATIDYFAFGISNFAAVESPSEPLGLHTNLDRIRPNPAARTAAVSYTLARAGTVELVLYDPVGRRLGTLAQGNQAAGRYDLSFPVASLSQGVYFCRLTVTDGAGTKRIIRKLQVAR